MADSHVILGYEVMATLGHGAGSTIYAVRDRNHHVYALKKVVKQTPSDQRFLDQAVLEHEVASRFNHPVLRRSYKLLRQRKLLRTTQVITLMEMVDGFTLEHFNNTDLVAACRLCQQAASGLAAMHQGGYVHADIKPNNILLTDKQEVKIIDFGQSCSIGTIKERIQGTPDYIAPEQVLRRKISPQTDVFNLGATMYWLLTRQHVPTLIPKSKTTLGIQAPPACQPPHELNDQVPPALSSLIMECIKIEPKHRPASMQKVHDRLELAISQLARQQDSAGQDMDDTTKPQRNAS